jgi:hypothetical protein
MSLSRRSFAAGALLGATALRPARADGWGETLVADVEGLGDIVPAIEAYVYGYPLVTMEMTRRVMTNVATAEGKRAPMGQFMRARSYPDASYRDVTAPNADTLYTTAWVDVGKEPAVLSLPDMKGRYYLFPMLDAWTNVFQAPGTRTTGTGAQTYAITGPGWSGTLPPGVVELKAPTALVWVLGRIYCTGTPEDYAAVHALQDACALVPLSSYGNPYTPPPSQVDPSVDMKTGVRDQVNRLDAVAFFGLLADLLKTNPPAPADKPMLATLARLGIVPGQDFDMSKFNVDFAKRVPQIGFDRIMLHYKLSDGDVQTVDGWAFTTKTGQYGTNYVQRALVTVIGLGANLPQDAVYPFSEKDGNGGSYSGASKYVVHFARGATPPAKGFWSITMYDKNYFFVANPLNRYSISMRQNPKFNADGSLDLYIQTGSPGPDKEANWLPAPQGGFILMMRLYWPDAAPPSILDGSWAPPPVAVAV